MSLIRVSKVLPKDIGGELPNLLLDNLPVNIFCQNFCHTNQYSRFTLSLYFLIIFPKVSKIMADILIFITEKGYGNLWNTCYRQTRLPKYTVRVK